MKAQLNNCLVLALLTGPLWACQTTVSSDSTSDSDVISSYVAVSIDGHALPYAPLNEGRQSSFVVSSVMTLYGDGTVVTIMHHALPSGGARSVDVRGTYTRVGFGFTMDWEMQPSWEGASQSKVTVEGSTLTMHHDDNVIVYEKVIESGRILRAYRAWED